MSDSDKIKDFIDDAKKAGIRTLLPSATASEWEFVPEPVADGGEAIRFGFGAVKGTGRAAIEAMCRSREKMLEDGKELGFHEMITAVDPHDMGRIAWEAVIKAGAFDELGHNRGALLAALESAMSDASQLAKDRRSGQVLHVRRLRRRGGGGAGRAQERRHRPAARSTQGRGARSRARGPRLLPLRAPLEERAGLVSPLSSCPIRNLDELSQSGGGQVRIAGLVLQKAELVVKSGKMAGAKMCRFRLEDLSGSVSVTCFPRTYADARDIIEDGAVLLVKGKLEEGSDEPAILLDDVFSLSDALSRFRGGLEPASSRGTGSSSKPSRKPATATAERARSTSRPWATTA